MTTSNRNLEISEVNTINLNSSINNKKSNTNSSNEKKRIRDTIEEEDNTVSGFKRGKIGDTKNYSEIGIQPKLEKDTNNSFISLNNEDKNYHSKVSDFFSKNDAMNLIWKLVIPKEEIIKLGNSKINFIENFMSKRNDMWVLDLELNNKSFLFNLKLKKLDHYGEITENKYNKSPSSNKKYSENIKNHLDEVFDSIYFDVDVSFQILNYKTQNFNFKKVTYNDDHHSELKKEINLNSDFFSQNYNLNMAPTRSNNKEKDKVSEDKDNLVIIAEFTIHKSFDNDINKVEGYNGIINEAATCYMNSMLQTLNIFGIFKKAVFQIPISEEDYKSNSVSLSLQRLFYDLMKDSCPVSTDRLVKSFGWGREQILIQHDVQEFNLLLSDVMEKKMKGTPSEGTFSRLFEGKLINYIKCINVDYKSEKEEKFNDLQLTIKGCKNIYESLNIYTEEETLDNADKYEADGFGKQTAKKGIRFIKFPPVLILQLKRFEYNPRKEAMVKINDHFEFYEEINLTNYMDSNYKLGYDNLNSKYTDENENENMYTLHSVVVHQGNANSGHYYAFIRPTMKDHWALFNDEIVRPADKYEVFKNNYGGGYNTYKHKAKGEITSNVNYFESNAYILVYIKNSERERILSPVSTNDICPNLIRRFENEKIEEKKHQMKILRISDNMNITVISNECIINEDNKNKQGVVNSFYDINLDEPFIFNKNQRMLISFPKYLTIFDFLNFINKETNIDLKKIKIYKYDGEEGNSENIIKNRGIFNLELIKQNDYNKQMIEFTNNLKKKLVCFYIHISDERLKLFSYKNNNFREEWNLQLESSNSLKNDKCVFISKDLNNYSLNKNYIINCDENNFKEQNEEEIIIFIKEFNKEFNYFKITNILNLKLSMYNSFNEIEEILTDSLKFTNKNEEINFLVEKRNNNPTNITNHNILTQNNFYNILNKSNYLILIPVLKSAENLILTKFDELYDIFYIDVFSIDKSSYVIKKMKINLAHLIEENQIKYFILEQIKETKMFKCLINLNNHYLIDQHKILTKIDENFLNNYVTIHNLELHSDRDRGPKFSSACKETPILKFINSFDCRIELNFNLYQKGNISENNLQEIALYDKNNNKILNLTIILPKKIKKCREIIDFLYDTILSDPSLVKEVHNRDEYFIILQNSDKNYIYNILIDNSSELNRYEGKTENIEFRLQPFISEDIDVFQDSNHLKIFIAVNDLANTDKANNKIINPMVIYLDKSISLFELKLIIQEKIKKMTIKNFNFEEIMNTHEIKFYTAKIQDFKITKDLNLKQYKDEDEIENIFKDLRVYNILVEILKNTKNK